MKTSLDFFTYLLRDPSINGVALGKETLKKKSWIRVSDRSLLNPTRQRRCVCWVSVSSSIVSWFSAPQYDQLFVLSSLTCQFWSTPGLPATELHVENERHPRVRSRAVVGPWEHGGLLCLHKVRTWRVRLWAGQSWKSRSRWVRACPECPVSKGIGQWAEPVILSP